MEIGIVRQVNIVDEMRDAYLNYAMSVITARALPDVRDGLKPVQRRILYAMEDMGLRHDRPHKKSARIVGEVLGKYHPHGDAAVYDAMVRLAQDFTMRYPLVDGHGNFGSIDGDNAAAMRYTEARLAAIAEEMLVDIDKDTVDFADNFDGTLQEPRVLPSRLPNLLINGTAGIAVGMATNIPPHNLSEVCDAIAFLIDRYDDIDDVTVEDLMRYIKGPDFPTGGSIAGREGIISAYATGKGRLIVRAKAHIEDLKGGRTAIIVTELPYQVNKANLVEKIADLARNHRIETIADLRDESDRTGMRIVIELKRGADAQVTLNQLLKYTSMQTTFGVNMLALVAGEPRVLSLKRALQLFIEHRQEVISRRSRFELARAKNRAHILEGLKIALDNLDEVIDIIRRSRDADVARTNLVRRFKLSEVQAQAILDMQLRRLAALERRKIEEELTEVRKQIVYLQDLLAHPRKILLLIKQEMGDLRQKYGDARRTRIAEEESAEFAAEDLIPSEDALVVVTQHGYIKRVSKRSFSARARTGAAPTRQEDVVLHVFAANSMDSALCFTDRGRVYGVKVHQIPDESRQARGVPLSNLIGLDSDEALAAVVPVADFEQPDYLVLATVRGKVKRLQLRELSTARSSAMAVISLDEGDSLGWVRRTHGGQDLILVTAQGKAIRFSEDEVRPTGRMAGGVNAIRLAEGDRVAAADVVYPGCELVLVTRRGYGKRLSLDEFASQSRGGSGVLAIDTAKLKQTGPIVAARALAPEDFVLLISAEGVVLRASCKDIPRTSRSTRGSQVIELKSGDSLVALAPLNEGRDERVPSPVSEAEAASKPKARARGSKEAASRAGAGPRARKAVAGGEKKVSTRRAGAGSTASRGKAAAKARGVTGEGKAVAKAAKEKAKPTAGEGRTAKAKAADGPAKKAGAGRKLRSQESQTPADESRDAGGNKPPRRRAADKPVSGDTEEKPGARKPGSARSGSGQTGKKADASRPSRARKPA